MTKSFEKQLAKLPATVQRRLLDKVTGIAIDPYAANPNLKKLKGRPEYRLRMGDWRVIYQLRDNELLMLLLEVGARGSIY